MAGMVSPAQGRFSSGYGKRNYKPSPWHAGVDIAAPVGTPVYAPFAGTVRGLGANLAPGRSGDRNILISNPDGEGQYFGHLSRALVKVGQKVKAGQKIGQIGARGNVTGPHLHFETWANWRNPSSHFNPKVLFDKYGLSIGSKPLRAGGSTSTPAQRSVAAMASEVIAGKHGNGHANRRRSLGVSAAVYKQVRAEVNRRLA